jgi:DNA-binding LacI/PurR family transcriptional regulator
VSGPKKKSASPPPKAPLTVRELAKHLNLGKTTVALALRGSPLVSAETRQRVNEKARELGYIPNAIASAFLQQLRSKDAGRHRANLAFLRPRTQDGPFLRGLIGGAQERCAELGYGLDVIRVGESNASGLMRMLVARGISGLIVGPLAHSMGHLSLDWSKFACTAFGYSMARPALHRVAHHHFEGMRTAFRACRRRGFRRIGLAIDTESDKRSNRQWSSAYLGIQTMVPESQRVRPFLVSHEEYTPENIYEWIVAEKPDIIIVHAEGRIVGLDQLMRARKNEIPCVLLGKEEGDTRPGIDQRYHVCGRLLVESVSSQILHNERGIPKIPLISAVDGVWVDA